MRVSSAKAGEWAGDGLAPRASDAGRLVCEVPTLVCPPGSAWLEGSVGLDLNLYVPPDLGIPEGGSTWSRSSAWIRTSTFSAPWRWTSGADCWATGTVRHARLASARCRVGGWS